MEERIIDDEYGRGIRLKKTADGYVDATDELADGQTQDAVNEGEQTAADEIMFEFPDMQEDDEDLVGLSPEEALALRKKKEEEAAALLKLYRQTCAEGYDLLQSGSFKAAELKFEKALGLDGEAKEASVGYWRAKTNNFENPDVLADEYAEAGFENLEYDLGYGAVDEIKKQYKQVFEARLSQIEEEEKPLVTDLEEKQSARRVILKKRLKKRLIWFCAALLPTLAFLALGIYFASQILSTPDGRYVPPTVVFAGLFGVALVFFGVTINKLLNTLRIIRANEKLSSTEDGQRLEYLRDLKDIYTQLLD